MYHYGQPVCRDSVYFFEHHMSFPYSLNSKRGLQSATGVWILDLLFHLITLIFNRASGTRDVLCLQGAGCWVLFEKTVNISVISTASNTVFVFAILDATGESVHLLTEISGFGNCFAGRSFRLEFLSSFTNTRRAFYTGTCHSTSTPNDIPISILVGGCCGNIFCNHLICLVMFDGCP
jgi:hypothetical protein